MNEHPDLSEAKADRGQTASSIRETVLPLSDITVDTSIQCRASLNTRIVAEYAERMEKGDHFPPIDVFEVEGINLLADGFHRIEAAKRAGRKSMSVRIRHGTRRDALIFAIEANRAHGLRFCNKDKRRAVELALREVADCTDGAIAEMVGVSQPFVSKLRGQLITVMSSGTRTGRDGKKRHVPKKAKTTEADGTGPSTAAATDGRAHDADTGRKRRNERPSSPKGRFLYDVTLVNRLLNRLRQTLDSYCTLPREPRIRDELLKLHPNLRDLFGVLHDICGLEGEDLRPAHRLLAASAVRHQPAADTAPISPVLPPCAQSRLACRHTENNK